MDSTTSSQSSSLLTLSGDLLRSIANLLPPTDRVALSQTSKTLFAETWSTFGLNDLLARFPFERRVTFPLSPALPGVSPLRAVPDRAAQQHVYAAISADGRLAAVLPYDNVLRLIDMRLRVIIHSLSLPIPALSSDVWDLEDGFRRPTSPGDPGKRYADRAAVDPESALEFSSDSSLLLLSCARFAHIYSVLEEGKLASAIVVETTSVLRTLRTLFPPPVEQAAWPVDFAGAAGSATLSPDGKTLAWIMFLGFPARAFLTLWTIDACNGKAIWTSYTALGALGTPNGSALAWVRATFHGNHVAIALNSTRRMLRTERVGDTFRRTKLCRFRFYSVRLPRVHAQDNDEPVELQAAATSAAWLSLAPGVYPATLAAHLRNVIAASGDDGDGLKKGEKRAVVALNCVHTSPSEATYKALEFGENSRHPWFVAKQPLYSIHFCIPQSHICYEAQPRQRVLVASAAHDNTVSVLAWTPGTSNAATTGSLSAAVADGLNGGGGDSDGSGEQSQVSGDRITVESVGRFEEQSPGRQYAFRGLPWRAAFASVSSFAPGGRWIVGAALLNDECIVCVRNVTDIEYYGRVL